MYAEDDGFEDQHFTRAADIRQSRSSTTRCNSRYISEGFVQYSQPSLNGTSNNTFFSFLFLTFLFCVCCIVCVCILVVLLMPLLQLKFFIISDMTKTFVLFFHSSLVSFFILHIRYTSPF